jgi:hypothetical protein
MMYLKRYCLFSMVCMIFFVSNTTYRNQIHKVVTLTLPFYPSHYAPIKNDALTSMGKSNHSLIGVFLGSSAADLNNNALIQCDIMNNPPLSSSVPRFLGVTPESVTINKELDQPNPLYDTTTLLLSALGSNPIVVTKESPATICLIEQLITTSHQSMLVTPPLNDIYGDPSEGIIGLTIGTTGTQEFELSSYIFAAVKKNKSHSDKEEDGISVVKIDKNVTKEIKKNPDGEETVTEKREYFFNVLNSVTGKSNGNKAITLAGKALQINGHIPQSAHIVDLCWCPYLERLYVALQTKNADDASFEHGARALLVGRIDTNEQLILDPIASDALCVGNDKIIGACGAAASLSLHKIRSMITSTGFPYLIIVGDIGQPDKTTKKLYALPLADRSFTQQRDGVMVDPLHGTIASKYAVPLNRYLVTTYGQKLIGRALYNHAETIEEMPTDHDAATQIGVLQELPHAVTDVIVAGDAIFVTVAEPGAGQQPGIFHSQAILDGYGKIAAWTPWQRIGGIEEGIKTAFINTEQHFLAYLKAEKPELVCHIQLAVPEDKKVNHEDEVSTDLSDVMSQIFAQDESGVQGLFDFPFTTPGFGTKKRVSMLVATGYKKIALIETGSDDAQGVFHGYTQGFMKSNTDSEAPRVIVMTDEALEHLGSITCSTIITDGKQSWLVVGGVHGVAVLAQKNGCGWNNEPGLLPHFEGLVSEMNFKKFGTYKYVKKLMSDDNNLYILTNSTFEKVRITAEIVNGQIEGNSILASSHQIKGAFFDMGVSGPLAVLATSQGLLINGSGTDIRFDDQEEMNWKSIYLPYAKGSVYNLFFVSSNGQSNGFGHQGQLYASVGSLAENQTTVYRLYVHDVFTEGVTDKSVELLPDHIFANQPFPLFSLNTFRDHFITNGAYYFSTQSRQAYERPSLHMLSLPNIKSMISREAPYYGLPLNIGKRTKKITAVTQNSATGNWLIGGDFGLRIHN